MGKKCCLEKPVPSQVVTATVLSKPKGLMSVATKVAVQMNCKLGGEPWAVKIPLTDTMVIGYDTYHDTSQKGRSVGAVVARIIMYRDGVGDGQINYVIDHEIAAIMSCLANAGLPEDQVKFTYVIVSKRINTRFFRMNGPPTNPPSGTVVDDVVTLPERYDFFLVSQSVRQGTVNPTSYNVIKDTSGLKPDH